MKRLPYLVFSVAVLAGCSEQRAQTESLTEPVYSRQYRERSMTAIVTLSETNITTSGRIQLMIDVHAPANIEVALPEIGNAIDPFAVADGYTEPVQTLPNGKQLTRRVWMLTPGLGGTTDFQPLEIYAGSEIVKTEPIRVTVESLLPPGTDSFEIKDIAEPIALLPQQEQKRRSIYVILIAVLGLVTVPLLVHLFRKPKTETIILPREAALQALENLPEDQLEKIRTLNGILLTFIGARFNVSVSGKTLDEILPTLPKDILLGRRPLLEEFLITSEQARFSHAISDDFATGMETFAHKFIEATPEEKSCD